MKKYTTVLITQWGLDVASQSWISLMVGNLSPDFFDVRISAINPDNDWPGGDIYFFYFVPAYDVP